jgi:hypothetical protein
MAKQKIDHEVSVTVTPEKVGYTVTAISLDHEIYEVDVWECVGKLTPPTNAGSWARKGGANPFALSGGTRKVPPPHPDTWAALPEQDAYMVQFLLPDSTIFPICIDVYEEGAKLKGGAAEPKDAHRHGWFTENGNIYEDSKGPGHDKQNCKGWYGLLEDQESASLPAPANPHP